MDQNENDIEVTVEAEKASKAVKAKANKDAKALATETEQEATTPAPRKKAPKSPHAVVGNGKTDTVSLSIILDPRQRKSLSIHHLQRRLGELGYQEAVSARDGRLDKLTRNAINKWQADNGREVGADLTMQDLQDIFENDSNVTLAI